MESDNTDQRQRAIKQYRQASSAYVPPDPDAAHKFKLLVQESLFVANLHEKLAASGAVILERIARGAGTTCWYLCPDAAHIDTIAERLHAGSLVSFYFDNRITQRFDSPQCRIDIEKTIVETSDCVVGVLNQDGVEIEMFHYASTHDFDGQIEFTSSRQVFYGKYPGRDNDMINAITFRLPDSDGVVRKHPY